MVLSRKSLGKLVKEARIIKSPKIAEACGVPISYFQDEKTINEDIDRFIKNQLTNLKDDDIPKIREELKKDPDTKINYIYEHLKNNTKYRNGYVEPQRMTVEEYLSDCLENYIKENRKINTYYRYKGIFDCNIKKSIVSFLLKDLKPLHIENLILHEKKKKLSDSTLQNIYSVLNSSFNRAVKLQIMNDNPCRFVDRPKREKFVANTLTIEEINKIFNLLDNENYNDYIMSTAFGGKIKKHHAET